MNKIDLVVITGAGRGIGKAIALDFGKKGIDVLCISKSKNSVLTKNEIINKGGKAFSLELDIRNYDEVSQKITNWYKNHSIYKKIGFVFAASVLGKKTDSKNLDLNDWEETMKVNLFGNLAVYNTFLPILFQEQFGRFMFFAGGGSAYEFPLFAAYSASKTAVVRTVENLEAMLLGKGDFVFSVVAPGAINTDMLQEVKKAGAEVRTTLDISEPVNFAYHFLNSYKCNFSGRFVHVRDIWKDYLNNDNMIENNDLWKLRRIEK
jgi:NAD(P)-dependent dehydrogenase (short-subunit alcohol dehydrogenase family)